MSRKIWDFYQKYFDWQCPKLDTPILNYYFKSVRVDRYLYDKIKKARIKMGYIK
ncbi:hypothetical protein ABEV41_01015 [Geobacillus thermodenitrificans]|uniref:hypothetical protein n=1 Tax=Geobacillus thermodenitrificans TaxID=33940 RepID=UPI003D192A4E